MCVINFNRPRISTAPLAKSWPAEHEYINGNSRTKSAPALIATLARVNSSTIAGDPRCVKFDDINTTQAPELVKKFREPAINLS